MAKENVIRESRKFMTQKSNNFGFWLGKSHKFIGKHDKKKHKFMTGKTL